MQNCPKPLELSEHILNFWQMVLMPIEEVLRVFFTITDICVCVNYTLTRLQTTNIKPDNKVTVAFPRSLIYLFIFSPRGCPRVTELDVIVWSNAARMTGKHCLYCRRIAFADVRRHN